jgi:hypothetical protein
MIITERISAGKQNGVILLEEGAKAVNKADIGLLFRRVVFEM